MSELQKRQTTSLEEICVWHKASTNKQTMKSEMPQTCQLKKCDGYNKKCLAYQPTKKYNGS